MTTPLEQADIVLEQWATRTARIDQNLVDLASDPVYNVLQKAPLEGVTREKVVPALAQMEDLFVRRRLLEDVIDRARAIRSTVTTFRHGRRLAEVDRLLREPTIAVSTPAPAVTGRNLLDPEEPEQRLTPTQILAAMIEGFDDVRAVVAAVGLQWDELTPRLDTAEAELQQLDASARAGGAAAMARRDEVARAISRARHLVAADPLGEGQAAVAVLPGNLAALRRYLQP